MEQTPDYQRMVYGKVIARSWDDDAYKAQLLSDPRTVLSEAGIDVPDDVDVTISEQQPGQVHFVLPAKPVEGEISDQALQTVAGGFCCCCCNDSWYGDDSSMMG